MTVKPLEREILVRGFRDHIQLAEIISVAHFDLGIDFGDDMYATVGDSLRWLLGEGLAEIGDLMSKDGKTLVFVRWPGGGDADQVVRIVLEKWRALGRDPNLNEVSWLSLTEKGRTLAAELRDQDRGVAE
jgi:hypothetical protein